MPTRTRLTLISQGIYAFISGSGDFNAGTALTSEGLSVINAQRHMTLGGDILRTLTQET